jgi:hypothetical protein
MPLSAPPRQLDGSPVPGTTRVFAVDGDRSSLSHGENRGSIPLDASLSMTTNVHIRAFEAADLEAIQRIRVVAFEPIFRSFREIVGETISALALTQADVEQAEHLASVCDPNSLGS